jgi:hypothetical protein
MPGDRVAAELLRLVSASNREASSGSTAQPVRPAETPVAANPAAPTARPIDPASLVGTWKASRADESRFSLVLGADRKFDWSFQQKAQPLQSFGGTYTVEGNVLVLERKDGGSLVAEIVIDGDSRFNFRLLGADADDKGLDFAR